MKMKEIGPREGCISSKIFDLRSPTWSNYLHFDAVFFKFWPNNRLAPSPLGLSPPFWEIMDPLQSCGRNYLRNNKKLQQNWNSLNRDLDYVALNPFTKVTG